jgi:toxin YoeB
MRPVKFQPDAFNEFTAWAERDKKTFRKINSLIKDIDRNPFSGIGKPEPLKHNLAGYWSRRIDEVNRLVYTISSNNEIIITSCFNHY